MIRALVLTALLVPATAGADTLAETRADLIARFEAFGAFEATEAEDTLILTCTNCEQEVEIIVTVLEDVASQTEETPLERYIAERSARCFTLVADREGRCVETEGLSGGGLTGYSSLAEPRRGVEERELVYQSGGDLLIGRITYERRFALIRSLEATLDEALQSLAP